MITSRGGGRGLIALSALAAIAAISPATGSAAIRFAEAGGNGPATSCPQTDPCGIQDAIEHASVQPGDTIRLFSNGFYATTAPLTVNERVTIEGAPNQERPRIIADFTGAHGEDEALVINANGTVVRDLYIELMEDTEFFSIALQIFSAATVERVEAVSSGAFGRAIEVQAPTGQTTVIRDSIAWTSSNDPAIQTAGSTPPGQIRILNVSAYSTGANGRDALRLADNFGSQDVTVRNSIIAATKAGEDDIVVDGTDGSPTSTVQLAIDHSNFDDVGVIGADATYVPGLGNQTAAPSLDAPVNDKFEQLPDSITVDAGATDPLLGSLDFGRQPRLLDLRPDIGADELDLLVPETTLVRGPRRRIHRRRATFRLSSNEPSATFECKLDRRPFRACGAVKRYRRLRPGRHRFRARAVDGVGKRDQTPVQRRFRVNL